MLSANKICLNVRKTEVALYKSLKKQRDYELHLKLNGKRIYPINSMKYLVIITGKKFTCHRQINNVVAKLNRADVMMLDVMLSKIRHFMNFITLT